MVAALDDDEHVDEQRERYLAPGALRPALRAGVPIDHSEGGLYLWATRASRAGTRRVVRRARDPGGAGRLLRPAAAGTSGSL